MFGSHLTSSLASAGVFAVAISVGSHLSDWVLSKTLKRPPRTILLPLSLSLGLMAVTPVLLTAAVVGAYSPPVFGLIGWILTAFIRFEYSGCTWRDLRAPVSALLLAMAAAAMAISLFCSGEHLYGGRDQGFYTNIAIWMAHNGKTVVDVPLGLKDQELLRALGPGILGSGLYFDHGQIVSQFSHAYPVWLAQAFAVGGHVGIYAMNAFLAGTCVLLFFATARSLMRPGPALIATAFLAFSPAQIWISRITLSELLAQQAFLSMSILLVWAVRLKCPRLIVAAAFSGAFIFLTRIDGMLVLPPLLIGTALAFLQEGGDLFRTKALYRRFCIFAVGTFVLCGVYYWFDSRPYLISLGAGVVPILALAAASCLLLFAFRKEVTDRLRPIFNSAYPRIGLVVVLAGLFVWAYFIRRNLGIDPASFRTLGTHEATAAFRANSLWNLGEYLSPVSLFAGFAGFCWFLLSRKETRKRWHVLPFVIVWFEFALFYIQDPRISADHPWAIRRFVPVVLPGFILFAFFLLDRFEAVLRKRISPVILRAVVLVSMAVFFYHATPPSMLRREYAGSREFLSELAAQIPDDVPVFAYGSYMWKLPLRLEFDKPVFFLDLSKKSDRRAAAEIAAELSGGKCVVIHDYTFPHLAGPGNTMDFAWTITRLQPTPYPLAHEWITGTFRIGLDFVDDATVLIGVKSPWLGGQKVPGVSESGFWGQEFEGSQPFRWTKATATLGIPLEEGMHPSSLRIKYKGIHPKGSDVVVTVNGKQLYSGHLTDQTGTIVVEGLDQAGITDHIDLEIEATPFKPVDVGMGSDDRELGIRITQIEVDDDKE